MSLSKRNRRTIAGEDWGKGESSYMLLLTVYNSAAIVQTITEIPFKNYKYTRRMIQQSHILQIYPKDMKGYVLHHAYSRNTQNSQNMKSIKVPIVR